MWVAVLVSLNVVFSRCLRWVSLAISQNLNCSTLCDAKWVETFSDGEDGKGETLYKSLRSKTLNEAVNFKQETRLNVSSKLGMQESCQSQILRWRVERRLYEWNRRCAKTGEFTWEFWRLRWILSWDHFPFHVPPFQMSSLTLNLSGSAGFNGVTGASGPPPDPLPSYWALVLLFLPLLTALGNLMVIFR